MLDIHFICTLYTHHHHGAKQSTVDVVPAVCLIDFSSFLVLD